jgi:hypothetical protein
MSTASSAAIILLSCFSLANCAKPAKAPAPVEWYVASTNPVTMCPKGFVVPAFKPSQAPTFVYLADRRTRFYIPPRNVAAMNQALAVREASITVPDKVFRTTEGILTFIGQFTILTLYAAARVGGGT